MAFAGHNRGKQYVPGHGYIIARHALRVLITGVGKDLKCPFCRAYTNTENSIHACSCGKRWARKRNGDYVFF